MKKILILSSKFDKSIDGVSAILKGNGCFVKRINTEEFPVKLIGSVTIKQKEFNSQFNVLNKFRFTDFDSIWHRHPGKAIADENLKGKAKDFVLQESQLFLNGLCIANESNSFWVSKLSKIMMSSHRIYQLSIAHKIGFKIPNTLITNDSRRVLQLHKECKNGIIAKAVGVGVPVKNYEGYNYYEIVYTKLLDKETLKNNLDSIKYSPTIFQSYIDKDVELRVTVVGNDVFACAIHSQSHADGKVKIDWRRVSPTEIQHSIFELPNKIKKLCVQLVKELGLQYGAIDIIKNKNGEFEFLEINADGQYGWIQYLTGMKIDERMAKLLIEHK